MPTNLPIVHIPQPPDEMTRALFGCEKIRLLRQSGHELSLRTVLTRGQHSPDLQLCITRDDTSFVLEFSGAHAFMSLLGWARNTGNIPICVYRQIRGLDPKPVEVIDSTEICMCLDILRFASEHREAFDASVKEEIARERGEAPTTPPASFGRCIDID